MKTYFIYKFTGNPNLKETYVKLEKMFGKGYIFDKVHPDAGKKNNRGEIRKLYVKDMTNGYFKRVVVDTSYGYGRFMKEEIKLAKKLKIPIKYINLNKNMKLQKILFICKFNRFRSQVAEAYFNQINKNKLYKCCSAGFILPFSNTLQPDQVKVARENGVKMKGKPKSITAKMLKDSDIYVIVADDIPGGMINGRKYGKQQFVWKIPDAHHDDPKAIAKSVNMIKKKLESLIKFL